MTWLDRRLQANHRLESRRNVAHHYDLSVDFYRRFLDPDMHHYAMACGETIVQVHGQSPLQFNYVNPEDDPSRNR